MMIQKIFSLILLSFLFSSCREIEEKYLYDSDDPRVIELQYKKCIAEKIYSDLSAANLLANMNLSKAYRYRIYEKTGTDGSEMLDGDWGVRLAIESGELAISLINSSSFFKITISEDSLGKTLDPNSDPDPDNSDTPVSLLGEIRRGSCLKNSFSRSTSNTSLTFSHTVRRIIDSSLDDDEKNPRLYNEFIRKFTINTSTPSIFYFMNGSITLNKIQNGKNIGTSLKRFELKDLDCSNPDLSSFCVGAGSATPCTLSIESKTYNKKTVSNDSTEVNLVKSTDSGCSGLPFF